jgi:hypothetical protein
MIAVTPHMWDEWPLVYEGIDNKDIGLFKYEEKLVMTYINKESGSWKYGSWRVTKENNGIKSIQYKGFNEERISCKFFDFLQCWDYRYYICWWENIFLMWWFLISRLLMWWRVHFPFQFTFITQKEAQTLEFHGLQEQFLLILA